MNQMYIEQNFEIEAEHHYLNYRLRERRRRNSDS